MLSEKPPTPQHFQQTHAKTELLMHAYIISAISSHNKYVLSNFNSPTQQPDTCNCRRKPDCPLEGKRLQTNVIYQANVTIATRTDTYVGTGNKL